MAKRLSRIERDIERLKEKISEYSDFVLCSGAGRWRDWQPHGNVPECCSTAPGKNAEWAAKKAKGALAGGRLANFCCALFACLQKLECCASTSSSLRLLAQSSVLPFGGIAVYPMQTVMRFSRCSGQNDNKKAVTKQTSPAFTFSGRSC